MIWLRKSWDAAARALLSVVFCENSAKADPTSFGYIFAGSKSEAFAFKVRNAMSKQNAPG